MPISKTTKLLFLGTILLVFFIIFLICAYISIQPLIISYSLPSQATIDNITQSLSKNTTDIYDIARKTSKFVNETINHKTWDKSWKNPLVFRRWFITRYPFTVFYRVTENRTIPYLLNSRIGACGEHAYLYSYLMSQMGIPAPIIHLNAGTHAINEIRKDGEIIIVDSSHNAFNESRESEMFPNKQIKYVEVVYLNGTTLDYTKVYAKESTGEVSIQALFFNKPLRNFSLVFYSGIGIPKTTNREGYVNAPLGNYTYGIRPKNLLLKMLLTQHKIKVVENELLRTKIRFRFSLLFYLLLLLAGCLIYEYRLIKRKKKRNSYK